MHSLKEKVKDQLSTGLDVKIIRLIDKLLHFAVAGEADEIYFEPRQDKLAVDFLINGDVNKSIALPKKSAAAVIDGLKKIAGLDQTSANLPEQGKFKKDFLGYKIIFSLSTHATSRGEKMIIGLKKEKFRLLSVGRLGLSGKALAAVKKNLEKRKGMILVIGADGSGRTTALYGLLNYLNRPDLNLATVEKEIACVLPAVNQSRLDPLSGFSSAHAVHSLKRQDADVAMISELNDKETAVAAFQLALSGHFVLSGLDCQDPPAALNFLQDLFIPTPLFSAAVKMVINQRLLDKNCPYCLVRQKISALAWRKIKTSFDLIRLMKRLRQDKIISEKVTKPEDLVFYKSRGCSRCGRRGKAGKLGIFEVLEINEEVKRIIRTGHYSFLAKALENQGNYLLREDALIKAMQGLTSASEVLKVI